LLALSVLTYFTCISLLWRDELREERHHRGSLRSLLCFVWLQPRYDAGWGFSPTSRAQSQQLGVDSVFVCLGNSLRRWPSLHHKHLRVSLQLAQA
jgi:hypothetical protein